MWVASVGIWNDCVPRIPTNDGPWPDAETISDEPWTLDWTTCELNGPFDTQADAIAWLRAHSLALGTDDERAASGKLPWPDEAYAFYTSELVPPANVVTFHLGDAPDELSVDTAVGIISDELDRRRNIR